MKLSVITVSYNSAATIRRTLESVVIQRSAVDVEYIVIDGGSTDGTVDIIRSFNSDIDYWVSEPDEGIYPAMNKGLGLSSGDWIGVLNSDDWYARGALSHILQLAQEAPDAGMIIGAKVRISDDGRLGKIDSPPKDGFSAAYRPNHPASFISRSTLRKLGGYNTGYVLAADLEYLARAQKNPSVKVVRTNRVIAYMRGGGAGAAFRGISEAVAIEREYNGVLSAIRVLLVLRFRQLRQSLAHLFLPTEVAHAIERLYWKWRYEVIEPSEWSLPERNNS